jgi:hypothetical protein
LNRIYQWKGGESELWRNKKFIIIAAVVAALLLGTVGTFALAQSSTAGGSSKTLLARVAAILNIDQHKVEDAFAQAQEEMKSDALENYLNKMLDEGKITQSQADKYKKWLQAKPDMSEYNQALKEWQGSKPDVPIPGNGLPGRIGGMMNRRGF